MEKVGLQELGLRFTMKLLWTEQGIAGSGEETKILMEGKSDWEVDSKGQGIPSLETSKQKFFP